jgi:hypothetical protein
MRIKTKELWQDPSYRKSHIDAQLANWANEEYREKYTKILQEGSRKEETQKKFLETIYRIAKDPEINKKRSDSLKLYYSKPENAAKRSGPNSPTWKGGKSFEPYCIKFNKKVKFDVRNRFDFKCFECGCEEGHKAHAVHHIDYNKNSICNGKEWPLIPLCPSCHSKTNCNRWFWFNKYINYWAIDERINFRGSMI